MLSAFDGHLVASADDTRVDEQRRRNDQQPSLRASGV